MTEAQSTPAGPQFTVPDFREDERVIARYDAMLQRRIKDFYAEHESSIRRNAVTKSDDLKAQLDDANAEYDQKTAIADAARESYRAAYPHHVKKLRLDEPSMIENVRTMGAAKKLYQVAQDAKRAVDNAASAIRKIEHNEAQLGIELEKALEKAPAVSKDVTESEKWLAEIHADEELRLAKSKVDAVAAEREAYAARLAVGTVSAEEKRLRAFGEAGYKMIAMPVDGIAFLRIEQFGDQTYFIVRDSRKQQYALPYDRRLEPALSGVFDISRSGKEFVVRRSTKPDGHTTITLLDHFTRCESDAAAAQEAYRLQQDFAKEKRFVATMTDMHDTEAAAIELLAAFVAPKMN